MENKLPEIDRNVAHPQAVWFNEHWRPVIEQLKADLQITRHKIETLLTLNMRQDAETQQLKSKLKIASAALEVVKVHNGINSHYPILHHTVSVALSEIGGEI